MYRLCASLRYVTFSWWAKEDAIMFKHYDIMSSHGLDNCLNKIHQRFENHLQGWENNFQQSLSSKNWRAAWWCTSQSLRTAGVYKNKSVTRRRRTCNLYRRNAFLRNLYRRGHCSSVTQQKWPQGFSRKLPVEIGPKDNATILRCIWQERFLLCLLPLCSRSKIRILMTSWQWFAQKKKKKRLYALQSSTSALAFTEKECNRERSSNSQILTWT